jgi:hypothetical protein
MGRVVKRRREVLVPVPLASGLRGPYLTSSLAYSSLRSGPEGCPRPKQAPWGRVEGATNILLDNRLRP